MDHYRTTLSDKIEEIFTNLQQMIISEIQSLDDSCPSNCQYAFSKLSDAVYGAGYHAYIDIEKFKVYLGELVDFSNYQTWEELYVIIIAGFYTINTNTKVV